MSGSATAGTWSQFVFLLLFFTAGANSLVLKRLVNEITGVECRGDIRKMQFTASLSRNRMKVPIKTNLAKNDRLQFKEFTPLKATNFIMGGYTKPRGLQVSKLAYSSRNFR